MYEAYHSNDPNLWVKDMIKIKIKDALYASSSPTFIVEGVASPLIAIAAEKSIT